jgi:uncharacterized short protein YbdD (DUF466 family)
MAETVNPSTARAGVGFDSVALRQWLERLVRQMWRGIREWCGDAAYESYLRSRRTRRAAGCPLTAKEFYVEQLERRYSRPNRCC